MDEVQFTSEWNRATGAYEITARLGPYVMQESIETCYYRSDELLDYIQAVKDRMARRLADCVGDWQHSPGTFSVNITGVGSHYMEYRRSWDWNGEIPTNTDQLVFKQTEPWKKVAQKYGLAEPRDEEYEAFCEWDQEEPE